MQKKLIALALASLAGSAFAQSNVTIYGVADATFDNVRATGATAGDTSDFKSRNRVSSNSSYIGFKGVEDLGNGLKAVFQFENGIKLENGAAGSWNDRDSYVGVAGAFGTVVAGNVTGPTRALGNKLDVNAGATGIGANTALLGKLGGGAGASAFDQRITNAIAYISPSFSGFTGVVGYSTGLTNQYGDTATATLKGRESAPAGDVARGNVAWTVGLNYENGPIYVGYAYTTVNASEDGAAALGADGLATGWKKLQDHRLGGFYKFGTVAQVGLLWDQAQLSPTNGDKLKQNVYYVSGKFNVTPAGAIIAQYGWANDIKNGADDTGAKHLALGYEHALSKRTLLKAVYSQINNKDNANYDYLYGVSNPNTTASTTGLSTDGTNVKGFSVGIRHSF